MRFAGQAIRSAGRQGRFGMPKFRAQSGSISDFSARPTVQGLAPSMNQMREENAASYTKTVQPDMSNPPFTIGQFVEPEFRA